MATKHLPPSYHLSEDDQQKLDAMNATYTTEKETLGGKTWRAIAKTIIENPDYQAIKLKERALNQQYRNDNKEYFDALAWVNQAITTLKTKQKELDVLQIQLNADKDSVEQKKLYLQYKQDQIDGADRIGRSHYPKWTKEKMYLKHGLENGTETPTGVERKMRCIEFLIDAGMYTPEHVEQIMAVQFVENQSITVGPTAYAWENLKASDVGMQYTQDSKENPADYTQAHVFTGNPDFPDENYFTPEAINQLQQQWKVNFPSFADMKNTLKALPGEIPTVRTQSRQSRKKWSAKILSILLWTQMSSKRCDGMRIHVTNVPYDYSKNNGFLASFSTCTISWWDAKWDVKLWVFNWTKEGGRLLLQNKETAFPVRPLATVE
jgi:hypothetical protein